MNYSSFFCLNSSFGDLSQSLFFWPHSFGAFVLVIFFCPLLLSSIRWTVDSLRFISPLFLMSLLAYLPLRALLFSLSFFYFDPRRFFSLYGTSCPVMVSLLPHSSFVYMVIFFRISSPRLTPLCAVDSSNVSYSYLIWWTLHILYLRPSLHVFLSGLRLTNVGKNSSFFASVQGWPTRFESVQVGFSITILPFYGLSYGFRSSFH